MKEKIVMLHENPRKIDLGYFENYGGHNYSDSYKGFTIDPARVIDSLVELGITVDTLLDAGCASGELVRDFRRLGVKAYGIEKNTDILKKCVVPQFCTQMDIRNLSEIKKETFHLIYCNALMYLYPQEILPILKEFHRICTKAVYLCNPYLENNLKDTFEDPSRIFLATETWWTKQFQEAGFKKLAQNVYTK